MKRPLFSAMLFCAVALTAQNPAYSNRQLSAVTTTTTGTAVDNSVVGRQLQFWVAVVHVTGAPTGCTISIKTSTSTGGTFANVTAYTGTGFSANPFTCTGANTDAIIGVYCPSDANNCSAIEVDLTALSGGTSPTVTATLYGYNMPVTLAQIVGTVTVSGTVTANQGAAGSAWPVNNTPQSGLPNYTTTAPANGQITANTQTVCFSPPSAGYNSFSFNLTGTWTGTVAFQYFADSACATAVGGIYSFKTPTANTYLKSVSNTAQDGFYTFMFPPGVRTVGVTSTAWTSGTLTVAASAEVGIGPHYMTDAHSTSGDFFPFTGLLANSQPGLGVGFVGQNAASPPSNQFTGQVNINGQASNLGATLYASGATMDPLKQAALATMPANSTTTGRAYPGGLLTTTIPKISVTSNPAAGSQASATIAAEASVRHVCDCIGFSASAVAAPALTSLTINLRDGATGAGTVVRTWQVAISAGTGIQVAPFEVCGLGIVGTTNTAMTLEWSAGLANLSQAANLSVYNVP